MALLTPALRLASRALGRAIAQRPAIVAASVALCVAMMRAGARADDSTAIVSAMDTLYASKIFTRIHWTSLQISEAWPYAMFFAANGKVGVDDLLEESGGRWSVVIPSKGIEDQRLLMSYHVPKLVAARLLHQCPPSISSSTGPGGTTTTMIDPSLYRAPFAFAFKLEGRAAHSTIASVRIPAQTLHFHDGNSERIDIAPPINAQLCTPR